MIAAAKSAAPINMNVSGEIGLLSAGDNKVTSGRTERHWCYRSECDEITWELLCGIGKQCFIYTVTQG